MTGNRKRYWFAHPAGRPKSYWPVSWQGFALMMLQIAVLVGVGQAAGRALWNQSWLAAIGAIAVVVLLTGVGYFAVARRTCDPVRTAEDYEKNGRERRRKRQERLARYVEAKRAESRRRRNITE